MLFLLTDLFITVENLSKQTAKILKNNTCFIQNKLYGLSYMNNPN